MPACPEIQNVDFLVRSTLQIRNVAQENPLEIHKSSHNMCENKPKKTVLVCAYKSENFAQNRENYAPLHGHETVTFINSAPGPVKG